MLLIAGTIAFSLFVCLYFWMSLGAPGLPENIRDRATVIFFVLEGVILTGFCILALR